MHIVPLPAFNDNYIWLMHNGRHAVAVDPGDAGPVQDFIAQHGLTLAAILITHHHHDHIGGIAALAGDAPVYGPARESIAGVTTRLVEGDTVSIDALGVSFGVLDIPGHTAGHIAYLAPGTLFCGDTLFSAGCGRLFDGTAAQLFASLTKLAALPDDTQVYCTHEYTLANLAFASAAEPHNPARDAWLETCRRLRSNGQPTLPTTIGREKAVNPFLRVAQASVAAGLTAHLGSAPADAQGRFTRLREWKNTF
ncbi:MAG: hydroxyacylglutathione hydrolase [Rhodocyclaceae bacterium]|nr:hydroxyacylglutathione hydrolase [Rhodocyclaceae bacterium]MCB1964241.1 hydroxyacylglutathione hydrolase [Rhodocyclaceae bacterium]